MPSFPCIQWHIVLPGATLHTETYGSHWFSLKIHKQNTKSLGGKKKSHLTKPTPPNPENNYKSYSHSFILLFVSINCGATYNSVVQNTLQQFLHETTYEQFLSACTGFLCSRTKSMVQLRKQKFCMQRTFIFPTGIFQRIF